MSSEEIKDAGSNTVTGVNMLIQGIKQDGLSADNISDGYHTFGELYEFRMMYNALLFNAWAEEHMKNQQDIKNGWMIANNPPPRYAVHKSWKHSDGELAFGGGWFIVSAMLPTGLISNHYKAEHWDLFKVPEVNQALFEFDGHTSADVLERLKNL